MTYLAVCQDNIGGLDIKSFISQAKRDEQLYLGNLQYYFPYDLEEEDV